VFGFAVGFGFAVFNINPAAVVSCGNVENPASFAGFSKRRGNGGKVPGLDFSTVSTARHFHRKSVTL
jgi:hypothetical protein